jgi:hypothetical protein
VLLGSSVLCFDVVCGGCEWLQVVSAVVNNDLQGLVESRPLKVWKETLALICTVRDSYGVITGDMRVLWHELNFFEGSLILFQVLLSPCPTIPFGLSRSL